MPIATHLIEVQGTFDENWTEEKLKEYVKRKFKTEIDGGWHPDLELFGIEQPNIIKIWVYVQEAASGLANRKVIEKWLKDHVKEEGLIVTNFEIKETKWKKGFILELNDVALENL